ncbi:MAG TPA: hypothetical protein VE978_24715 [Chitinophagales bacterium]|nr:hypothetical protein [Chitinophagales bacterium]
MKKILYKKILFLYPLLLIITATCTILFYNSCKKDDSSNSANDCDRTCYLGTWAVTSQNCTSGYNVTIIEAPGDATSIDIGNFDNFNANAYLTAGVSGATISFTNKSNGSKSYTGTGTLSSDKKTISVSYSSVSGSCTETWTKQ